MVDLRRSAARGVVAARTYAELDAAGVSLAAAVKKVGVERWPRFLGDAERRAMTAVSNRALPGVIMASATGADTIVGGILLGGIILYSLINREQASKPTGPRPATPQSSPPAPVIVEAAVPLPPPKEGETPTDVLKPSGQHVGEPGNNSGVRILPGGDEGARELFDRLTKDGEDITRPGHIGKVVKTPSGVVIGYRPKSKSGPPTIDVKGIPGLRELKFPGGRSQ